MSGNLRREHIQRFIEFARPAYLFSEAYTRFTSDSTNWSLDMRQLSWGGEDNCQYCGQLYPREKFYGGCPSCGAPHE